VDLLKNLEDEIMACTKCARLHAITPNPHPHIYYNSPDKLKIFVIGRNPGLEYEHIEVTRENFMEFYKEKFLICRVGQYLIKHLGEKIVTKKMFFCNVCKCCSPNNEKLFPSEKENCFPYLERQIEIIKPKLIIALGADAQEALAQKSENRKFNGIPIIGMYHPSYFKYLPINDPKKIRQESLLESIKEKFK
jgi:DNA polymerase